MQLKPFSVRKPFTFSSLKDIHFRFNLMYAFMNTPKLLSFRIGSLTIVGVGRGAVEVFIITIPRRRHIIHGQAAVYAAVVAVGVRLVGVIGHLVVRSTDRGRGGRLKGIAVHNILIWFLAIWKCRNAEKGFGEKGEQQIELVA